MIDVSTWKKAWALLDARERRNAWLVLAVVVISGLSAALMVGSVMPFLSVLAEPNRIRDVDALGFLYDLGGFQSDFAFLVWLGVASLGAILIANGLQIMRTWAVARFTSMRLHSLSHRLLISYLRQPYEYFLDHHTGEMSTQILAESQEVVARFYSPAADVVASTLTVLCIVALLLWVNFSVAVITFLVLGGLYGITFFASRKLIKRAGAVRADTNKERFRLANEALGGVKDIKLLGREYSYTHRYRNPSQRMAQAIVSVQVSSQIPQYFMQAVGFGGIILLSLVLLDPASLGSGAALGGLLPLLGVFAFAGQRLLPELSKIYKGMIQLSYGAIAVDTVHRDLVTSRDSRVADAPVRPPPPMGLRRSFELDSVSYHYPNAPEAGLFDVSLRIHAGEKIGIVGSTGAGKTTLADIVLGLLRPLTGELRVDDTEVDADNLRAWQQTVGYVPQDIFLTDASVAENIALGVPAAEISQERVAQSARTARIDRFVLNELPKGFESQIGERGVRLSGGQRQRIGIARALYHNADLIVFDEATSALDNVTEREVMSAIEALPGDKTILMIAHRLSTVKTCDRIAVLHQGRVVGLDSWDALMATNPVFQEIAQSTSTSAATG